MPVDRGTKRRCPHCAAPFYDLNRRPIVCPKCEEEVRPEAVVKVPVRGRAVPRAAAPAPVVAEEPEDAGAFEEDEVLEPVEDNDDDEDIVDGGTLDDDRDEMRE